MADETTATATPATDKLGDILAAKGGRNMQAFPDILGLIISIILPLIQGCFQRQGTPETVAAAMRSRPIMSRAALWTAIREAGLMFHPQRALVYDVIVEAGFRATAADVTSLVSENEL